MDQRYRGEREAEDLLLGLAAEMQAEHRSAVRADGVRDAAGGDADDSRREALAAWTSADALRLVRVIRALAEAGLIDECHVVIARAGRAAVDVTLQSTDQVVPFSPRPVSALMTAAKGNRKGKIVSSKNSSPDGVDEDPTAVEGLSIGGWFSEADRGEDGERFTLAKTLGTNALLPGRQVRALRRGMAIAG